MSLQTRLAALISAIGADIKALSSGKAPASHTHTAGQVSGLGTAATENVTTSTTDTTAGRLMKVGDFGTGATNAIILPDIDAALSTPNGSYVYVSGLSDGTAPFGTDVAYIIHSRGMSSATQIATNAQSTQPRIATRRFHTSLGSWTPWHEIYTTANLIYAQLSSGTSVAPHATTAGSNLTPAQTGTWRNVSNTTVNNGAYSLWMRV